MIDLHTHIIPGVDDGARSWEEAVTMCRMAWKDGIKIMVATPHAFNGLYDYQSDHILDRMAMLRERLQEEGIELTVLQGAEVYSRPDLPSLLDRNPALTLNQGGRYFLLEFPHSVIPPNSAELIFQLKLKNIVPIIAHPERNLRIQENVSVLEEFVRLGALCQLTAMSFTGGFGQRARECANVLLDKGCVHVVASDAHGVKRRPPILSEAWSYVSDRLGVSRARELFELFPQKVLSGEYK